MGGTDHAPYLLALRLAGRRVTIIGGGVLAARRIPALLDSGADVVVISPELSPPVARLAEAGQIRWVTRGYAAGDCAGSWLVGAFTSDRVVNAAVAAEAGVQAREAAASSARTHHTPVASASAATAALTSGSLANAPTSQEPAPSPAA